MKLRQSFKNYQKSKLLNPSHETGLKTFLFLFAAVSTF
jgi:hypothetical protein